MILYFLLNAQMPFVAGLRDAKTAFMAGQLPEISWTNFSPPVRLLALKALAVDMRNRPAPMELLRNQVFHDQPEPPKQGWINDFFSSWCECQMRSKQSSREVTRSKSSEPSSKPSTSTSS